METVTAALEYNLFMLTPLYLTPFVGFEPASRIRVYLRAFAASTPSRCCLKNFTISSDVPSG